MTDTNPKLTPARRREIGAALWAVAVEIAAIKAAKKEKGHAVR